MSGNDWPESLEAEIIPMLIGKTFRTEINNVAERLLSAWRIDLAEEVEVSSIKLMGTVDLTITTGEDGEPCLQVTILGVEE